MSAANVQRRLEARAKEVAIDFKANGIKADGVAESTSGSGVTISSKVIRSGGDKTLAIAVPDGAAYTVLAANSGKIHLIADQAQDVTLTLPTAAAGLSYEFWPKKIAADDFDWIFNTGSDTNFFLGGVLWIDSDVAETTASEVTIVVGDGNSNSKLQVNLPSVGTCIKLYCDGTNWFLNGTVMSTTVPAFADQ